MPRRLVTEGIAHTTARLAVGLAFGIAFGLTGGLTGGLTKGLAFALTFGLASAFASPWPRYLLACLLLARRNEVPVRPAVFLDWAYDAGLMRLAGTAVQFRHREFQDWLIRDDRAAAAAGAASCRCGSVRRAVILTPFRRMAITSSRRTVTDRRSRNHTLG